MAALVALLPLRQPSATSSGDLANLRSQIDALQSEITLTNRINSLSNVTISSPTIPTPTISSPSVTGLEARDLPDVSGSYLSLSGGGAVTATSTFATSLGIGTTSPADAFALSGAAYLADISAPPVTTNRTHHRPRPQTRIRRPPTVAHLQPQQPPQLSKAARRNARTASAAALSEQPHL